MIRKQSTQGTWCCHDDCASTTANFNKPTLDFLRRRVFFFVCGWTKNLQKAWTQMAFSPNYGISSIPSTGREGSQKCQSPNLGVVFQLHERLDDRRMAFSRFCVRGEKGWGGGRTQPVPLPLCIKWGCRLRRYGWPCMERTFTWVRLWDAASGPTSLHLTKSYLWFRGHDGS